FTRQLSRRGRHPHGRRRDRGAGLPRDEPARPIAASVLEALTHHRLHVVLGDLAGRGVPDIAEALYAGQRLVEIFYAMRHAHQPGMDRQAEHLPALAVQELEGVADEVRVARGADLADPELLHVVPLRLVGYGDELPADLHRVGLIIVRPV